MTKTQLPSDALARPMSKRAILIAVLAVAAVAAVTVVLVIGGTAWRAASAPKPTPTLQIAGPDLTAAFVVGQGNAVTADQETQAMAQEQALEAAQAAAQAAAAAAAAQAAADAAAQQAAQQKAAAQKTPSSSGGLPSGATVPQPNGYPDTTLCASGSASTVNGVPTCD